jgi:hypothetical protein
MTLAVRNYSSGAENVANAHAIRQRLLRPANAFRPKKPSIDLVVVNRAAPPPMWQRADIDFDEHVKAWQWHRITVKSNRYKEYVIKRCIELCVDYHEIVGPSLLRSLTEPRQMIWYEMKTKLGLSYPRIAREFGGRDHTTIMAGCQRVAKIRGDSPPEKVNSLERLLRDRELNASVHYEYKTGMAVNDLGIKFGISPRAISAVIKIETWERDKRDRNNTSRSAKINLAELRRDWEAGNGVQRLVAWHGVSDRTIRRLAKENGWQRKGKE